MKYTQVMTAIMNQTGSWVKQIFQEKNTPMSIMPKESEFPKQLRLPKNAALDSRKVGMLFIRWLEYMIKSGNFIVNHPTSPIHKPCDNVIGIVKFHALELFCEAYGLNDYWTPYPKNSIYKAIKKTQRFLSAYGRHTFKCHVKSKIGRIHMLPLLLIDEECLKLTDMNISVNHSLILDHHDPFDNQRNLLNFKLKFVTSILLQWKRKAEAVKNQKHSGSECLYTEQALEALNSPLDSIQTATGINLKKIKTFASFDPSLLQPLPDCPLLSKEMGDFFVHWLKVMIKHRRFEINETGSPIHKITEYHIGLLSPQIFMIFCQDYGLLIEKTNAQSNQIRNSVKKAGYLVPYSTAKKEIFKCNVVGKPYALYFCLILEKHLIENNESIPVNHTLILNDTPKSHPKN